MLRAVAWPKIARSNCILLGHLGHFGLMAFSAFSTIVALLAKLPLWDSPWQSSDTPWELPRIRQTRKHTRARTRTHAHTFGQAICQAYVRTRVKCSHPFGRQRHEDKQKISTSGHLLFSLCTKVGLHETLVIAFRHIRSKKAHRGPQD